MKPIVIFVDKEKGKVSFDANEFKKICNEIYQQGYDDGYNAGKNNFWYYTSPIILTSDKINIKTSTTTGSHKKWWDDIGITCQSNTIAVDNDLHMPTESNDCIKGSRFDNN